MEGTASPLVLTKLRLPAARARTIPRLHLVELLCSQSGENNGGLILVCAPAGYGKTTLLWAWARRMMKEGTAVAWYALDANDDDPIPFGSYLVASFIQALGPLPELIQAAQRLRTSSDESLLRILPSLINAVMASGRDCVLVLDDYHLIGSPGVHSAVAYLVEHRPENLRIAIGSRSDPPLPLARLRARGQLLEVRAARLRFTVDETAQFLNEIMQLELSPQEVSALDERTEGWVAGLQLAALSLAGRADKERFIASFSGSHRYLVEYLMEEVVNRQPEEVRSFLLSTSILERMCAPLCDAMLGTASQCEVILKQLEAANLFVVALDDQGTWFRYHHLFRDFLQTRLNRLQPGRVNALHRAASEWLASNQYLREASGHAFQTHDWEFAAAFVEQHSFTMIIHSEIALIYEWCSAFPEDVMQAHPLLYVHQCWALAFSFRRENKARIEARLQQAERVAALLDDKLRASEIRENIAVIRTFLSMAPDPSADAQKQLAASQEMLKHYPEGDAGRFSALITTGYAYMAMHEVQAATTAFETARQIALGARLYFGVVESTFHLARLLQSQAKLRQAAEICRQTQAEITALLPQAEQDLPGVGGLDIALGCVHLEQDRLEEAEGCLRRGLDLIGWGMNTYYLMIGYTALFRLCALQGRTEEALKNLARLEEAWPDIAFCTQGLRVTLALRTAPDDPLTLAEAADWCNSFSPLGGEGWRPPGMGPFGAAEVYYLAFLSWVKAQIAIGRPQAARESLERQLELEEACGLFERVIELSLLKAQACDAEGDHQQASAALERALALAQPEGYVRIFDQGPGLARLLEETANRGTLRTYAGQILAAIAPPGADGLESKGERLRGDIPGDSRLPALVEALSARELEILGLVARGASNGAIAEQLVITVGTVKSHINHILGKLGAHNRTEAVARARELNLLEM